MSKFYLVRLTRTLTSEAVIKVEDSATEEDVLHTARGHAAGLANSDFGAPDHDAEILAENLKQIQEANQ